LLRRSGFRVQIEVAQQADLGQVVDQLAVGVQHQIGMGATSARSLVLSAPKTRCTCSPYWITRQPWETALPTALVDVSARAPQELAHGRLRGNAPERGGCRTGAGIDGVTDEHSALRRASDKGTRKSVSVWERVRSVSAGSPDLLNVELDHAIALIAAAGEHAPCDHHWPILRKRGRGCAVATLGFTFAGESKLLMTPRGRSSAYAKSAGRDLPTDFAVGRIHRQVHHTQRPGHGPMGRLDPPLVSVSSSGFSSSSHRVRL